MGAELPHLPVCIVYSVGAVVMVPLRVCGVDMQDGWKAGMAGRQVATLVGVGCNVGMAGKQVVAQGLTCMLAGSAGRQAGRLQCRA